MGSLRKIKGILAKFHPMLSLTLLKQSGFNGCQPRRVLTMLEHERKIQPYN